MPSSSDAPIRTEINLVLETSSLPISLHRYKPVFNCLLTLNPGSQFTPDFSLGLVSQTVIKQLIVITSKALLPKGYIIGQLTNARLIAKI